MFSDFMQKNDEVYQKTLFTFLQLLLGLWATSDSTWFEHISFLQKRAKVATYLKDDEVLRLGMQIFYIAILWIRLPVFNHH